MLLFFMLANLLSNNISTTAEPLEVERCAYEAVNIEEVQREEKSKKGLPIEIALPDTEDLIYKDYQYKFTQFSDIQKLINHRVNYDSKHVLNGKMVAFVARPWQARYNKGPLYFYKVYWGAVSPYGVFSMKQPIVLLDTLSEPKIIWDGNLFAVNKRLNEMNTSIPVGKFVIEERCLNSCNAIFFGRVQKGYGIKRESKPSFGLKVHAICKLRDADLFEFSTSDLLRLLR